MGKKYEPYVVRGEWTMKQPTAKQLKGLRQFIADQGIGWHEALMDCWSRGVWPKYGYDYGEVTAYCQQIRNEFGEGWLRTFDPTVKLPEGRRHGQRREVKR